MSATDPTHMIAEVDDPKISNEELGALVRAYKGVVRPPQVITVQPDWFSKTVVVLGFCLVFAIGIGGWVIYNATVANRQYGKDIKHVLCDPKRIPELLDADERTKQICGIP